MTIQEDVERVGAALQRLAYIALHTQPTGAMVEQLQETAETALSSYQNIQHTLQRYEEGKHLPDREALARMFHEEYEDAAPLYDYETREASAVPWSEVPEPNRSVMLHTAGNVLARLKPAIQHTLQRYEEVVKAARQVGAEIEGMVSASPEIASVIGNTNLAVLVGKMALLRKALSTIEEVGTDAAT